MRDSKSISREIDSGKLMARRLLSKLKRCPHCGEKPEVSIELVELYINCCASMSANFSDALDALKLDREMDDNGAYTDSAKWVCAEYLAGLWNQRAEF